MIGRFSAPLRRSAGVLLPLSALPSRGPIGDYGPAAYAFLDWLAKANQRYWQILPLSLPDSHGSPYASPSSLAASWLYVSPEILQRDGLLPGTFRWPTAVTSRARYRQAAAMKWRVVVASFHHFTASASPAQRRSFNDFRRSEQWWLTDYTVYQALKDRQGGLPWWRWPKAWQRPASARAHLDTRLRRRIDIHAYAQWLGWQQWQALRAYAHRRGVRIIGDIPFYVQDDSADVWASRSLFALRANGRPRSVAGVPPDDFNHQGQRWGNPVYAWSIHQRQKFSWWVQRCWRAAELFDLTRLDHFQGLAETYHIPATAQDGRRGVWVPTPGHRLLATILRRLPKMQFIAEDVGHPEPDAEYLRRHYHLPGIRLLPFAWNGLPRNIHHPQFLIENSLYYTSTHDTNTISGWWRHDAKWYERLHLQEFAGSIRRPVSRQLIDLAYASRARVVMVAVQDILGLGAAARFNRPGRRRGNWTWRLRPGQLTRTQAAFLHRLTYRHRRRRQGE